MQGEDSARGFAFAFAAYVLWGFLPLYLKLLAHIPAVEVVAHRVVWSVPIAAGTLLVLSRLDDLRAALRNRRTLAMGMLTAGILSLNWGIYVWAIATDRTLDAALGYYINPLFSVFLGAVLLGERLCRAQRAAIALAVIAVAVLTWETGRLPVAALALTLTWGAYAYFKRSLPIGPNQGFLLEVLVLLPPALVWMVWLGISGQGHFLAGASRDSWLLVGTGLATAVPLLLYANGAKLLRLSTIGIMQYTAPTIIFLTAVFVFEEPFGRARMIAFPLIWLALLIYTGAMLRAARARRRAARD